MSDYDFQLEFNPEFPSVSVVVQHVTTEGGGSGTDDRVDLVVGSNIYPLVSVTKTTLNGVSGVVWRYRDGSIDGYDVFVADGIGLNAVKTAIEAELSNVVSAVVTGETGSDIEDYNRLTITNRDGTTSVLNVASINTNTGKLSAANLPIQSTVTSGNTNPVNSVAVIAYINSLDATNTLY